MHGSSQKIRSRFVGKCVFEELEIEFKNADIPYEREKKLPVWYDDKPLKKYFRADFVCYDSIIIELKATKFFIEADYNQTVNNVKVTHFKLGILINFGEPSLKYRRIINSH